MGHWSWILKYRKKNIIPLLISILLEVSESTARCDFLADWDDLPRGISRHFPKSKRINYIKVNSEDLESSSERQWRKTRYSCFKVEIVMKSKSDHPIKFQIFHRNWGSFWDISLMETTKKQRIYLQHSRNKNKVCRDFFLLRSNFPSTFQRSTKRRIFRKFLVYALNILEPKEVSQWYFSSHFWAY